MMSLEFFFDIILQAELGPEVDSASKSKVYQEYFLGGEATGAWG